MEVAISKSGKLYVVTGENRYREIYMNADGDIMADTVEEFFIEEDSE